MNKAGAGCAGGEEVEDWLLTQQEALYHADGSRDQSFTALLGLAVQCVDFCSEVAKR